MKPHLSPRMACHWCRKAGKRVAAVIRVFSGMMSGEGFPACAEHRAVASELALEPLARPEELADNYSVIAFEVVLNASGEYYVLGRRLWTATPKQPRPMVEQIPPLA